MAWHPGRRDDGAVHLGSPAAGRRPRPPSGCASSTTRSTRAPRRSSGHRCGPACSRPRRWPTNGARQALRLPGATGRPRGRRPPSGGGVARRLDAVEHGRRGGGLQLWDWERFETGMVHGLDVCHFGINAVAARRARPRSRTPGPRARRFAADRPARPPARGGLPGAITCRYLVGAESELGDAIADRSLVMLDALREWLGLPRSAPAWLSQPAAPADAPVRERAPHALVMWLRAGSSRWGRLTSPWRMRPSFVIVGAQRAGTTTLYRVLSEHPQVVRPDGVQGHRLLRRAATPADRAGTAATSRSPAGRRKHGPARSPSRAAATTCFHPLAAARIARDLPGIGSW